MTTTTRPELAIAPPTLSLPIEAATKTFGIFGMRESGKSNAGIVLAEEFLRAGVPWCALDPVDHWWGLKARADGSPGFAVYVFGGGHADLPLEPTAGALMADVVAETRRPIVLCTADFGEGERRRFVRDFALQLRRRMRTNRHPLHVFLEEADDFVPQVPAKGDEAMVSAVSLLSLRSRQDGVGVSLITQRPARVKKDLTTQIHALVAFRLTGAQDRAAIDDWIRYHEDGARRREVLTGLATLAPGECFLWSPQWLEYFGKVQWRRRASYDAAATPTFGEHIVEPHLAEIDLEQLRGKMAATIEKAKADDPAELRRQVATLERQLSTQPAPVERVVERVVEVPVLSVSDAQIATLRGIAEAAEAHAETLRSAAQELYDAVGQVQVTGTRATQQETTATQQETGDQVVPVDWAAKTAEIEREDRLRVGVAGPRQRILDAVAWWKSVGVPMPTRLQVSLIAGLTIGGAFNSALRQLNEGGLIRYPFPGLVSLTDQGQAQAAVADVPRTASAIRERILSRLQATDRRILEPLLNVYPAARRRPELSEAARMTIGGSFNTSLKRLRSLGLVVYPQPGEVCAAAVLFPALSGALPSSLPT